MSEPFVNGPFPMRWEFDTLLNDLTAAAFEVPTNGVAYAEARADVLRAYDAALARIAELEAIHGKAFALAPGAHEVIAECSTWHDGCHCTSETLAHNIKRADEAEAALKSPAYRARIAREFLGELTSRYTDIDLDKSAFDCFLAVLDEWEAAAKEGV